MTPKQKKMLDQFIERTYSGANALVSPALDPIMAAAQRGVPPEWMQNAGDRAYNFLTMQSQSPQQQMPMQMVTQTRLKRRKQKPVMVADNGE